ncbi:MAG TPA: RdgB/HAM1 family non-canonical purine NTP pyrophosphatase [Pyrinomonadaceae bacterium]|jgi:XTP/dITP diphosphohydrolase
MEVVIATKNNGKVKELADILADLPVALRSLNDFENISEPEETGVDFIENASLKAREYARQTGLWSLADDSGLEVEALGNAPGVFSARYAGENATNEERIEKLLGELEKTGDENRRARFVCAMAVADEAGEIRFVAEGVCDGRITKAPRGANGFGYDPIFVPEGFSETFGELSDDVKREISHRARASKKIIAYLRDFIAVST